MNWNDLNLNMFTRLALVKDGTMLDLITAITGEDAGNLPLNELESWNNKLTFLDKPYKPSNPKKEYILNGITYIPVLNTKDILVNQFIDFQEFIKEPDTHITNLAAIFFIRKGYKYGDRDPIEEAKFLGEHLSITDYKDVFNFFLKAWRQYTNNTQASLISDLRKTLKKTKDKTIRIKILRTMINLKQIHLLESLI